MGVLLWARVPEQRSTPHAPFGLPPRHAVNGTVAGMPLWDVEIVDEEEKT